MPNIPSQPAASQAPVLRPPQEIFSPETLQALKNLKKPAAPAPAPAKDQAQIAPQPASGSAQTTVPLVDTKPKNQGVTQEEVQWAAQLEQQASQGIEPSDQDVARYHDIVQRLQAQRLANAQAAGVSPQDFEWAVQLEVKLAQGYQPNAEEAAKYQQIAQKLQQAQNAPAAQPPETPPQAPVAPQAPAAQPQAPQAPAQPPASGEVDLGNLVKEKVDLSPKFAELDKLVNKGLMMSLLEKFAGDPAAKAQQEDQIRQLGVSIWLEGDMQDRLKLAQTLVKTDHSDLLGRILTHEETEPLQVAELMSKTDFPTKEFVNDLKDNDAFLVLNALASVAAMGEPSSARVLHTAVEAYDRVWDREAPFKQLKEHLQANATWQKLPADLQSSIDKLLE